MEYALLGGTGLRVSRVALGTAVLGLAPLEERCGDLINAALDLGINVFDCANTYGNRSDFDRPGLPSASQRSHAEEILGRALKGVRDEVIICTKVSEPVGSGVNDGGYGNLDPTGRGGGLSRHHIMREVERSLRRLGTDHIDIYHFHHPDPDTRIEESLRAADDLVRQGKVRYLGLSTYPGWQLTEAVMAADHAQLSRPILNQVQYNMLNRVVEQEVIPAAEKLGLSISCYSPLAGGALAGTDVMNRRHSGARRWGVDQDHSPEHKDAAQQLDHLSRQWGETPARLALTWLLSRPAVATAIIGSETPEELRQSADVFGHNLDAAQLAQLDAVGRNRSEYEL
jgi:aryl-alcohol dehydrogenase-like predicted oxidoreductase